MSTLTLLAIDADPTHARVLSQAFSKAGFSLRLVPDARRALAGLRSAAGVGAVLLHGEPSGAELKELLAGMLREPRAARIPVVLLAQDATDAELVRHFRTGLVEILPTPFNAQKHPARVAQLLGELEARTGVVQGQNVGRIGEHIARTFRSGQLTANPTSPWPSSASFVNGELATAQHLGVTGQDAYLAMLALGSSPWSFAELSGADGDGMGVVLELGSADETSGEEIVLSTSDEAPAMAPEAVTDPALHAGPPTPILLVDDDPELCRMFRMLFERHGYRVTTAEDGLAGFDAALASEPALVVADLNMPRLDGWGLLRKLREDYRTRETPFALLSCQDDYRESLKALDAGAQAYFSKSTRLEQLAQKVNALLAPRKQFAAELAAGAVQAFSPQDLGPGWLLRELAAAKVTGTLVAKDSFASYRIALRQGQLVEAKAESGHHHATGERALNAFVASRCAQGTLEPGVPESSSVPLAPILDRAVQLLNANAERLREAMLVNAAVVEVNEDLYQVYRHNGPKPWLETARLLCEEKLAPRDVIAQTEASPVEVEETLRDLVRRGVVTLRV